jgi:acyl-CoA reductase-like NAD-dependent aldehyde dehydrogenase
MSAAPAIAISLDPATGQEIARHPFVTDAELEVILDRGQAGFAAWSAQSLEQRADALRAMAAVLRRDRESLAALATAEMGKVHAESLAEIEKCAVLCEWYADNGAQYLRDEPTLVPDDKAYVSYLPLGGAGHHAVEFPVLAGDARSRADPDGRQWFPAQAGREHRRYRPSARCRLARRGPAGRHLHRRQHQP